MVTTSYIVIGSAAGCTASAVYQVSVIPQPNLQAAASAYTICSNESTILTANGASNYVWSPSTGLTIMQGSQVNAKPPTTTVYQVTGSNGVCTAVVSLTI